MTFKLALRNILRHKARSIITISTIVFGCVAIIFIGGFFADLFDNMRVSHIKSELGHIQIYRQGFNEHGRVKPYAYLIENPDEIKALVKTIPEVKYITARIEFPGLISTGVNTISFLAQGIEPQHEKMTAKELTRNLRQYYKVAELGIPSMSFGKSLEPEDTYEAVLENGLAETMKVQVGTPIVLLTSTVHNATNALDVNVKGSFYTARKAFDDIYLRIPLKTAQSLLNTKSVQTLVIALHKTEDTDKVYKLLQTIVKNQKLDLELRRWEELADYYNKTVALFDMFYLVMRIVIGIVVVLGIFNTLNMAVMERISEIGTIMALGVRRRGVMELFLLEGLLLGVIGGVLGAIVGSIVVKIISTIGIAMPPPPGTTTAWLSTPDVVPSVVLSTFFLSIVIGGISALYPAYKASRMIIVEALRYR